MQETTQKMWLSDAVNYEDDIKPYNIVEVISGVGSGKNHWVEKILMKQYHVLLITSRKSKVEETRERTGYRHNLTSRTIRRLEEGCYDGFCDAAECNIICNNAHIESYLKYLYKKTDEATPLGGAKSILFVYPQANVCRIKLLHIKKVMPNCLISSLLQSLGECQFSADFDQLSNEIFFVDLASQIQRNYYLISVCRGVLVEQSLFLCGYKHR